MISLNKVKSIFKLCLSWMIYPLSFLFPRNDNIWIFTGWHRNSEREIFADNSKYLFLHVVNTHPEIRPIWISQDDKICSVLREHGFESYNVNSIKGAFYSLRAKYTIIDAIMPNAHWQYSGGSKTIQLWHAEGIKKLNLTHKWSIASFAEIFRHPGRFKKFFFLICSSPYISEKFMCPSFDVDERDLRITGLPRYDISLKNIPGAEIDMHIELGQMINEVRSKNAKRLIFYVPTFRRGKSLSEQLSPLNFHELDKFLKENNYFLFVSLHPKFATSNWVPENKYSNILFSNPGLDQIPYFKEFDVLITDYSSISIDFLFANKPTIYYIYDIDEYRNNEGLAEEFWNFMPGPRVKTFNELVAAISLDPKKLMENSVSEREYLFDYKDGSASERVVNAILENYLK